MAHPADDGRSVSFRNVPISVASSSSMSNTSTLPRIVGMDFTTIPEAIVQATASTSPSHTPRQEQEDLVPRYQNDASYELE
eukprot:4589601-Amphidinium_carterae.1